MSGAVRPLQLIRLLKKLFFFFQILLNVRRTSRPSMIVFVTVIMSWMISIT